jgi:6-phosphofructokinase
MVKDILLMRLEELGIKGALIDKDLGYELRSADPIPFDAEYTRDLGYGAVKFISSDAAAKYGAIISFVGGRMQPLAFEDMIDPNTKRMQVRKVNVDAEAYECARRYMIRLERADFENAETLAALGRVVRMSPEQFRARFGYLAGIASKYGG